MKAIFEKTLPQLILWLLGPLAIATGLRLATGSWDWVKTVPAWVWALALLLLLGLAWVRARLKTMHSPTLGISVISVPPYGWTNIGTMPYKEVLWVVRVPTAGPLFRESPGPADVRIATPPRCPICQTELEENPHLLYKFQWHCVRCGFKKRNKESIYTEVRRVQRLAQRHYEESGELDNLWQRLEP